MKFYAVLNENKICTGISQLSGEVTQGNMIEIESFSDAYLWKKYENEQWSTQIFEPASTAPLTEFEQLKSENTQMKQQLESTNQAIIELSMILGGGM